MERGQRVARATSVMATEVGEDAVVMMDVDLASYFGVEDVAADVWRMLDEPKSVDDLVTSLADTYDVDPQVCREETTSFVESLLDAGLVTAVD